MAYDCIVAIDSLQIYFDAPQIIFIYHHMLLIMSQIYHHIIFIINFISKSYPISSFHQFIQQNITPVNSLHQHQSTACFKSNFHCINVKSTYLQNYIMFPSLSHQTIKPTLLSSNTIQFFKCQVSKSNLHFTSNIFFHVFINLGRANKI